MMTRLFLLAAASLLVRTSQSTSPSPFSESAGVRQGSSKLLYNDDLKTSLPINRTEDYLSSAAELPQINHDQMQRAAARLRKSSSENTSMNDIPITAEFVADTKLPTDVGHFRLRAYRTEKNANEFVGTEPCVIYYKDKPPFGRNSDMPAEGVPVRVHDQCMTSEVFRSQR
jgi:hypothetical protein